MFMFIIYALTIYLVSIGASFYIKKDSKLYSLRGVIGFSTFLGVSQIFYYPLQYFKVPSYFVNICTILIIIPFLILGIKNLKIDDFKFFKSYEFWVLLILIFIFGKIIPGTDAGDDYFYMSLFKDNSNINRINTIDPRTGLIGKIDAIYLYQGYYLLMSFFYRIQNILFANNVNNIFISYRTTMTLITTIFASQIYLYIKNTYKKFVGRSFYLIQILSVFLVASLEWIHIYWGSFMIFQIFVPLIMIVFGNYLEDKKYKYILFFVNLGTLSLASSMLFLFGIIAFSYFFYELWNNKACLEEYFLILLPSFVYIAFVFNLLYLIPLTIFLFIIFIKFKDIINRVANKYLKYILLFLPILFIIFSVVGDYIFKIETYRVSKNTIVYNILITLYAIYRLIKDKKLDPNLFLFVIVTVYFFNPIVQPFVSHHLTSTYVYYRLFYITKNPFMVSIIFISVYEYVAQHKSHSLLKKFYISLLSLLIIIYGYHFYKGTISQKNYFIDYDYALREDIYSKQLGAEVKKLEDKSKIFSVYFAPRIYNEKLITKVARYPDDYDDWYKDIIMIVLYRVDEISNREYVWFNNKVREEDYDYLITYNNEKQLNNLRKEDYQIIYYNEMFVLIKVK